MIVARRGDALKLDAPRGALADLLPDLQRFKPALLELLEPPRTQFAPQRPEDHAREIYLLAATVLECERAGGGFDYGLLRPYLAAANELCGVTLTSSDLAAWARATVAQGMPEEVKA